MIIGNIFKGAIVGATMTVPGASGGTMAILLGIYNRLLYSVGNFTKEPGKNAVFLLSVAAGGVAGFYLVSGFIGDMLFFYPCFTAYLFIGLLAGGVPSLVGEALKLGSFKLYHLLPVPIGLAVGFVVSIIPMSEGNTVSLLLLFPAGLLLAAALVLPGISFSSVLMITGLYEPFINAVSDFRNLDLPFLLFLFAGILFGTVVFAKLFNRFYEKFPVGITMFILGFMLASAYDLFPGLPAAEEALSSAVAFVVGFCVIFLPKLLWRKKSDERVEEVG